MLFWYVIGANGCLKLRYNVHELVKGLLGGSHDLTQRRYAFVHVVVKSLLVDAGVLDADRDAMDFAADVKQS